MIVNQRRLLDRIIEIYTNPDRFLLTKQGDHNSPQRAVELRGEDVTTERKKNRIEFLFRTEELSDERNHPFNNHLITLPTTIDEREGCRYLTTRLESFSSELFCEYRVESMLFTDLAVGGGAILADVAIQKLHDGDLLSECSGFSRGSLLKSVELLERTLIKFNISFKELRPEDIIVGIDGRLYPFRYDMLRFGRTSASK